MRRSRWLPDLIPVAALAAAGLVNEIPATGFPPAPAGSPHAHVLALASGIGPRPGGSAADRRAVDHVRRALEEAGLAVELQPVDVLLETDGERRVGSWNVLARLAGDSPETLVVAAHHDSRGASVPGANDDASGVAVLIETARRVAARPRRVSYLFASFAAEEDGLLGSRHFARHADLSRVRAMIALEMLGQGELLVGPVPVPPPYWAQEALRRAARSAGARGVAARPLWSIAPRLLDLPYSADHEPFLDRGVPAFLLAGTAPGWTYHTPADTTDLVRPAALERAIDVLDRLLLDLEAAPPRTKPDAHYLPVMAAGHGVLIPSGVLRWIAALALAWLVGVMLMHPGALFRPARLVLGARVLIVAVAATILGLAGAFAGEFLLERLHGVHHPWWAHHGLHLSLGAAGMLFTGWLGLKLFRTIKPTVEPGPYGAAALLVPGVATAALLRSGWPELAFFAAVPLLAFLGSRLTGRPGRKIALGAAGFLAPALFLTPADYRALVDMGGLEPSTPFLYIAATLTALPWVLHVAHAASFQDCLHSRVWWWVSGGRVGAATLLVWVTMFGIAWSMPSYDAGHPQVVHLRLTIDLDAGRASARLASSDDLRGVTLRGAGPASRGRARTLDLPMPRPAPVLLHAEAVRDPREPRRVTVRVRLSTGHPTDRLVTTVTSRAGFVLAERGPEPRHSYAWTTVTPRADPEDTFGLLVPENGDLDLAVRAEFDTDLLGLNPLGSAHVFVHRAVITATRRLLEPAAAH